MRYCQTCILPETRPNIELYGDGTCNCGTNSKKNAIDWELREHQFSSLVREVKKRQCEYDCVIPVSGGKDSTWQVIKALEYGLRPLCVTWKTPARTDLGHQNLENLISLGVDHIDFSINPEVEKKFMLKTFEKVGSPAVPMHLALHAIPLKIAVNFGVPMILWGENSAFEYGGDEAQTGMELDEAWLEKFGVSNGTSAVDWVDKDLTAEELLPYTRPSTFAGKDQKITAAFLGYFFKWDPRITFAIAKERGFIDGNKPKTGLYSFADIDDEFIITIHHWMKWHKFGFNRLWDNLSIEIRNGRISRQAAIEKIREVGTEKPNSEIEKFCDFVGIDKRRFGEIVESHRNRSIWSKDSNGDHFIKSFLVADWDWSDEIKFE